MRTLAFVLLAIGFGALGWTGFVGLKTHEVQNVELVAPRPAATKTARPRTGEAIGRLAIPRLGVSVLVLEGTEARTLRVAAGHVRGTAMPGEDGNFAIAAHRDTFFRKLGLLRSGDEVVFNSNGGEQRYVVDRSRIVSPREVSVPNSSARAELTLITCYPFYYIGPAPQRYVVRAYAISTRH